MHQFNTMFRVSLFAARGNMVNVSVLGLRRLDYLEKSELLRRQSMCSILGRLAGCGLKAHFQHLRPCKDARVLNEHILQEAAA